MLMNFDLTSRLHVMGDGAKLHQMDNTITSSKISIADQTIMHFDLDVF